MRTAADQEPLNDYTQISQSAFFVFFSIRAPPQPNVVFSSSAGSWRESKYSVSHEIYSCGEEISDGVRWDAAPPEIAIFVFLSFNLVTYGVNCPNKID